VGLEFLAPVAAGIMQSIAIEEWRCYPLPPDA
jgi:hypothetical protein